VKLRPVRLALTKQYLEDNQLHAAIAGFALLVGALLTIGLAPMLRSKSGSASAATELPSGIAALLGIKPGVSLDTAAGHFDALMISLAAPLVLCALALPLVVRAIAGCEARGEMEWLAAQPIRRVQIVVERFLAIVLLMAQAALPATIALTFGATLGELNLSAVTVIWSMARVVILVGLLAGIALVASATGSSVRLAAATAAAVPLVAFGLVFFEQTAPVSPVRWTLGQTPAAASGTFAGVLLSIALTAWFVGMAATGFNRRDLVL